MGSLPHPLLHWRHKNRLYYRDLDRLHRWLIPPGLRVLEIGSGTGILLDQVQPAFGVGIDEDAEAITLAQVTFPQLHFRVQDAQELDLTHLDLEGCDQPFDVVILSNLIGGLKDIQVVLERLRPVCSPQTRLVITYHNPIWEPILAVASWWGQRMPLPEANWLSRRDVSNLLELAGFETIRWGKRLLLPRGIPLLSNWINRWIAPLPGINALCVTEYLVARPQPGAILPSDRSLQPSVSVVIPARNEAGNILNCVQTLPEMGSHTEIIFVEGNSTDQTWAEIQRVQALLQGQRDIKSWQQRGRGKADAVRLGFGQATGDILIILDADLTVKADDMPKFFAAVASGRCDMANGCRLVYPLSGETMPGLNRWANRFFAALLSYILGIRIKDSLCGTKVLRRQDYLTIAAHRHIFGDFDPFGDFDLLLGAVKQNLKIMDIPVRYYPRVYGQSNIAHVREGLKLLGICGFAARRFRFF
ncbi:MAG: glycosyltransferase [Synechococcaceae cyanobacterium SM2_3_2]|nr:glycosyltransferase [Synechococcaceae cyanobacterium SM2_3_2]